MSAPYEVATDELRQVKRRIIQGNGIVGPAFREAATSIETTIQRKWLISLGQPEYSGPKQGENDIDVTPDDQYSSQVWTPGKAEWRDLPTVFEGDWPMQAQ